MKKPKRRNRRGNGTQCVHHSLETESASVSVGRNPSRQQGLSSRSANAASKPGTCAREHNVPRACRQRHRPCAKHRENVTALHQRLSVLQAICKVTRCELGKT